jgi:hypothetical protein
VKVKGWIKDLIDPALIRHRLSFTLHPLPFTLHYSPFLYTSSNSTMIDIVAAMAKPL